MTRSIYLSLPIHVWKKDKKIPLSLNYFLGKSAFVKRDLFYIYKHKTILPRLLMYRRLRYNGAIKKYKIKYQFTFTSKRVKDPSNFWSIIEKVLLDTLVTAGYLSDDSNQYDFGREALRPVFDKSAEYDKVEIWLMEVL